LFNFERFHNLFFWRGEVLRTEPRGLYLLSTPSTYELHPQPLHNLLNMWNAVNDCLHVLSALFWLCVGVGQCPQKCSLQQFPHMHALTSVQPQTGEGPQALSSLVLCPSASQALHCLLSSGSPLGSVLVPFLLCGLDSLSRQKAGPVTASTSFLPSRDYCPSLPGVLCLETIASYALCVWFRLFNIGAGG
jgi:hypothetical protein